MLLCQYFFNACGQRAQAVKTRVFCAYVLAYMYEFILQASVCVGMISSATTCMYTDMHAHINVCRRDPHTVHISTYICIYLRIMKHEFRYNTLVRGALHLNPQVTPQPRGLSADPRPHLFLVFGEPMLMIPIKNLKWSF